MLTDRTLCGLRLPVEQIEAHEDTCQACQDEIEFAMQDILSEQPALSPEAQQFVDNLVKSFIDKSQQ